MIEPQPATPSEIRITTSPWVPATRASHYYGPVRVTLELPLHVDGWDKELVELDAALRDKAWSLGVEGRRPNWLVGAERTVDPFACAKGGARVLRLEAVATVALLYIVEGMGTQVTLEDGSVWPNR